MSFAFVALVSGAAHAASPVDAVTQRLQAIVRSGRYSARAARSVDEALRVGKQAPGGLTVYAHPKAGIVQHGTRETGGAVSTHEWNDGGMTLSGIDYEKGDAQIVSMIGDTLKYISHTHDRGWSGSGDVKIRTVETRTERLILGGTARVETHERSIQTLRQGLGAAGVGEVHVLKSRRSLHLLGMTIPAGRAQPSTED